MLSRLGFVLLVVLTIVSIPVRADEPEPTAPSSPYNVRTHGPNKTEQGPTEEEEKETPRRFEPIRGKYFGLGPSLLFNLNADTGLGYYFTAGYAFDANEAVFRLGGEFFGRGGALGFVGGLGVSFFPFDIENFSPFAGLDFGYGAALVDGAGVFSGNWVAGFAIGPIIGVQVMRSSTVGLELGLKWGFFLASGQRGSPSYALLRATLYF